MRIAFMKIAGAVAFLAFFAAGCGNHAAGGAHLVLDVDTSPPAQAPERDAAMGRATELAGSRLSDVGADSPRIVRDGTRLRIDVAGYSDIERLRRAFGPPPKLEFRPVDETITRDGIRAGNVPPGVEIFAQPAGYGQAREMLAVSRFVILRGGEIADARADFDSRDSRPAVTIRFNEWGRRILARFTSRHINSRIAIVLDGAVISAPAVTEPILGGSMLLSGSFTMSQTEDLATLLRASSVASPWKIVELRKTP